MAKAASATTGATSKHPGGRPLLYKTVKELEAKIEEYFAWCDNRTKSVFVKDLGDNIEVSDPAPYTMSGLAYALDMDRKSLLNYSKRDKFFLTIKKARQRVEQDVETRMNDKNTFTPGLIFNAKNNFGWVDKTEQDVKVEVPKPILGGLSASKDGDAIQRDDSN